MDPMLLLLRMLHVLAGVYWAGGILLFATFVAPAIREAGPEGGKVMQALLRRRYLDVMPAVSVVTILSGVWLLWQVSAGFEPTWFAAPAAHTLLLGMVTSLIAFGVGMFGIRPTVRRIAPRMQAAMQQPEGPAREAALAEVRAMQGRVQGMGTTVGVLLVVAVLTMAIWRYV
jgi:uncharacterized membrane protein